LAKDYLGDKLTAALVLLVLALAAAFTVAAIFIVT